MEGRGEEAARRGLGWLSGLLGVELGPGAGEGFAPSLCVWVRPFTFNSSATIRKELSSSCATFTSPWYMKFRTDWRSLNRTPRR